MISSAAPSVSPDPNTILMTNSSPLFPALQPERAGELSLALTSWIIAAVNLGSQYV
jgi:hypothetical protein